MSSKVAFKKPNSVKSSSGKSASKLVYDKNKNASAYTIGNLTAFLNKAEEVAIQSGRMSKDEVDQRNKAIATATNRAKEMISAEELQKKGLTKDSPDANKVINSIHLKAEYKQTVNQFKKDFLDELLSNGAVTLSDLTLKEEEASKKGNNITLNDVLAKIDEFARDLPGLIAWVSTKKASDFARASLVKIATNVGVRAADLKGLRKSQFKTSDGRKKESYTADEKRTKEAMDNRDIAKLYSLIVNQNVKDLSEKKAKVEKEIAQLKVKTPVTVDKNGHPIKDYTRLLSLPLPLLKKFASDLNITSNYSTEKLVYVISKELGGFSQHKVSGSDKKKEIEVLSKKDYKLQLQGIWEKNASRLKSPVEVLDFVRANFNADDLNMMGSASVKSIKKALTDYSTLDPTLKADLAEETTIDGIIQVLMGDASSKSYITGKRAAVQKSVSDCLEANDEDVLYVAHQLKVPVDRNSSKYEVCVAVAANTYGKIVAQLTDTIGSEQFAELRKMNAQDRMEALQDIARSLGLEYLVDELKDVNDLVRFYAMYAVKAKALQYGTAFEADVEALFDKQLNPAFKREIVARHPREWERIFSVLGGEALDVDAVLALVDKILGQGIGENLPARSPSLLRRANYSGAKAEQAKSFDNQFMKDYFKQPAKSLKKSPVKERASPMSASLSDKLLALRKMANADSLASVPEFNGPLSPRAQQSRVQSPRAQQSRVQSPRAQQSSLRQQSAAAAADLDDMLMNFGN